MSTTLRMCSINIGIAWSIQCHRCSSFLFSILGKILWSYSLRTDRIIMHFIIHSTLCGTFDSSSTFRTIAILHFALGSWGNVGPSPMFYICQLIDTLKIEIKSECFRVLSACRRVTAALPDPALVSRGGGSVIGVFSTVFSFIPYHFWAGSCLEKWKGENETELRGRGNKNHSTHWC